MKTWIHIISYDPSEDRVETAATCVFEDGKVECDGSDEIVVARLRSGLYSPSEGRAVMPADGEAFLAAVAAEFRAPHLFATAAKTGDEVAPYERPEPRSVNDAA